MRSHFRYCRLATAGNPNTGQQHSSPPIAERKWSAAHSYRKNLQGNNCPS